MIYVENGIQIIIIIFKSLLDFITNYDNFFVNNNIKIIKGENNSFVVLDVVKSGKNIKTLYS